MNVIIIPSQLSGTVTAPPSKSAAHRLLIAAALADAPTRVRIGALNRDIEATLDCLAALGARIEHNGDALEVCPIPSNATCPRAGGATRPLQAGVAAAGIEPNGATPPLQAGTVEGSAALDCGESGSTLRFLLPVACALGRGARVVGHGRLPERPNAPLVNALRAHGAAIDSDLLPMRLSGRIRGGLWTLPGDVSSQYVTGLLFALPLLDEDSEIALTTPLASAAYVTMTLAALRRFGVEIEATERGWRVPGNQRYRSPGSIDVEGDWSAAAFWFAANALGASVRVAGLDPESAQGDRAVVALLGRPEIDAENVPDLVPALCAAAASMPQTTVVIGAARLRLKESDRLATTAAMLAALGHRAEVAPDGLIVRGGAPEPCKADIRTVDGANDHRIVMAAAVAAASADRPVRITGAEAVEKSYPDFFRDYAKLGGQVHVEHPGQ